MTALSESACAEFENADAWVPQGRDLELAAIAAPTVLAYHGRRRHLKRAFDVTVVLLALPIVLPVMLVIALCIAVQTRGRVLFRQDRVGQDGAIFSFWKFRTMCLDSEERLRSDPEFYARYVEHGFKLKSNEDPRVFAFGRFLRGTSLDELPQLLCVLAGRMSLVGPRPVTPEEHELYGVYRHAYISVRPGITGRWQVAGRSSVQYPERAMLDAGYLEEWTFGEDLKILLKTVPSVLRRHGAH